MISFRTRLLRFGEQGEKTGWTYILIPAQTAGALFPDRKKSFRVKGRLDNHAIESVALLPMGGGDFILPVNASMRRGLRKSAGAELLVRLELDSRPQEVDAQFLECLADEPGALAFFESLSPSMRNYFSKWISSAKTEPTRVRRIADAVDALARGLGYSEMIRMLKKQRGGDIPDK